jgi:EAL domain-containing protein (putative c-di-GMP-specific phosphodiesterase class I)
MSNENNNPKIMVIDDDPFALKILLRQLNALGYGDVAGYELAAAALSKLRTNPSSADIVICDLSMPEMDGVEFIRHLATTHFRGSLALVSGESRRVLQSVERLASDHKLKILGALTKPVAPLDLAAVLNHMSASDNTLPKRKQYEVDRLQQALDQDELINYYQPQVSVSTGDLVGFEALVRWQHPDDGMVYPDQFIALAEKGALIDQLTERVLMQAMKQLRTWDDAGLEVNVSVNVSMDNLSHLGFPEFIDQHAARFGVTLSRLILEVTESRLMRDRLPTLDNLVRLRLKRVGLSIDDFGTGHSSLAQLRDVPFTELKIDRSFTHGAADNPSLRAIFNASLGMASQLEINTVAEGVEDISDWFFLQEVGCDLAQGYFIGRPMPAAALAEWCETWSSRRPALFPKT